MKFLVAFFAIYTVAYGFVPKLDGRIVGGEEVNIEDFPYQVSVRIYDQHICGGAILDQDTILTAAHCVSGEDHSEFSVHVGANLHDEGIYHNVDDVREHLYYNPKTDENDMAILKLSRKISFTDSVQPVELQPRGIEVKPGTKAWVSGWGKLVEGGSYPDSLRAVELSVISNEECLRKYGGNGRITERMLCAHTLYKDSCQGDSGGPLVANGVLIGVVSWGKGCARPQFPGVYAKVSALYDWIQNNRY